jgi:hypothetical protein
MHLLTVPLRRAIFTGAPQGATPPGSDNETPRTLLSLTPRRPLWWSGHGVSTSAAGSDPVRGFSLRDPGCRLQRVAGGWTSCNPRCQPSAVSYQLFGCWMLMTDSRELPSRKGSSFLRMALVAGQGRYDDPVAQATDSRAGDRDLVARAQIFGRVSGIADAFRSTGKQNVAGKQAHGQREFL